MLRVGSTGDDRPFSARHEFSGIGIDRAAPLGVRLAIVPTSWPALMDDRAASKACVDRWLHHAIVGKEYEAIAAR